MHNPITNAFFTVEELRWTPELVKIRLREAARGQERIEKAPGPSNKLTFWIDYRLFKDMEQFDRNAQAQGVVEKTRAPDRPGLGLNDREIARIEEAVEWPLQYLKEADDERTALKVWIWCEARRQSFSEFYVLAATHRTQAIRNRDRAFGLICDGLLRDGVRA